MGPGGGSGGAVLCHTMACILPHIGQRPVVLSIESKDEERIHNIADSGGYMHMHIPESGGIVLPLYSLPCAGPTASAQRLCFATGRSTYRPYLTVRS